MATLLWLLRHGEAVPHGAKPDSDRELTPRGEHQSRTAGRALARVGLAFDACCTSPKVRARDTAALACEELGVSFELVSSMAAGFSREDAEEVLALHPDAQTVLFVGHEPDFSQLVHDFTGARLELRKGGVAAVRLDGSRAELVALMRPEELEAMSG